MNIYNIKMDNLTYTKGYYGASTVELDGMMKKMYDDGKAFQTAWSYLDKDTVAQHMLSNSGHYQMKVRWDHFFNREMYRIKYK